MYGVNNNNNGNNNNSCIDMWKRIKANCTCDKHFGSSFIFFVCFPMFFVRPSETLDELYNYVFLVLLLIKECMITDFFSQLFIDLKKF